MLPKIKRTNERMDFLSCVIITAVEGGIGYWSQVSDYKWFDPDLEGGSAEHPDGQCNAYVTIHETEDDEMVKTIGVDDIARALGIIRKGVFPPSEGISSDRRAMIMLGDKDNDGGEIDSDLADCIVQIAMFGKVVYG